MKVLITGAGGMLGSDLVQALQGEHEVIALSRKPTQIAGVHACAFDLTEVTHLEELCERQKPDLIFHCAAMTQVDECETDRGRSIRDNVEITRNVVKAANQTKSFLIFFSTDYVFDGEKKSPYQETDTPQPRSAYGEDKLFAEQFIEQASEGYAIFRLSWLFGMNGRSFPRTILERAAGGQKVFQIVSDQRGRPTFTRDLAEAFGQALKKQDFQRKAEKQIFHLANEGETNWADFARFVFDNSGHSKIEIQKITAEQLGRPAKRPANSVFDLTKAAKTLGMRLRPWQEAVLEFVGEQQRLSFLQRKA